jgi:glycosyltransferase involved in cell wall biosynthesis
MLVPSVGILMPCRGELPLVQRAVESIQAQTFRDYEFLIIDDASDLLVQEYLVGIKDPRIKLVRHEQAFGVSASLNEGLKLLSTDLVFRMDSDDLARPDRLKKQIHFMQNNPAIVILGGQISFLNSSQKSPRVPLTDREIGYRLNWSNALNHPTVVYRRAAVIEAGGYNELLASAQDYDLWTRMFLRSPMANLSDVVLDYRLHSAQNSLLRKDSSKSLRSIIRQDFRMKLTGTLVSDLFDYQEDWTPSNYPDAQAWSFWTKYLHQLHAHFLESKHGAVLNYGRDLARRYWHSAQRYQQVGGDPGDYRKVIKQFNRMYALSKGLF